MKVCVFGAGAVGGHFAVRLAASGVEVSVIARGEHLKAIRHSGLTLQVGEDMTTAPLASSDRPEDLGVQDIVIATVKATGLAAFAEQMAPLLGPTTAVVFAQNGAPWWYGLRLPASKPPAPNLAFLDPGRRLAAAIGPERIIGGVIFSSNEVIRPGVIVNDSPERNALFIGEIDDRQSQRIAELRNAMAVAGLHSPVVTDIRQMVWSKLVNNMTISVLCLLTGQTARAAVEDPALEATVRRLFVEARAVAAAHGAGLETMAPFGGRAPDHKPSILQDYERRRMLEIDALIRGPAAFARQAGLATPTLDAIAALAVSKAARAGPSAVNPHQL